MRRQAQQRDAVDGFGPPVSSAVSRWRKAQQLAASEGIDALLVTPGADLRYLTGYTALPLERLTCLVLPASGDPTLDRPGS